MNHRESHLDRVIDALRILNPQPQEPLDAKTLAELIDLTPKQASDCLSRLHCTGYLARVGTNDRRALYVLKKPLKVKASTVWRAYRHRLMKRDQQDYIGVRRQIASKIAQAAIRAIEKELVRQVRPTTSVGATRQLSLPEPWLRTQHSKFKGRNAEAALLNTQMGRS